MAHRHQFTQKSGPRKGQGYDIKFGPSGSAQRVYGSGATAAATGGDLGRFDSTGDAQTRGREHTPLKIGNVGHRFQKGLSNTQNQGGPRPGTGPRKYAMRQMLGRGK